MRYTFETNWDEEYGYRVIDTSDGGVVYGDLGSSRDADIVARLLNERAALFEEVAALGRERDALCNLLNKRAAPERDERDTVEDCPHNVRERDAHMGNPTCAHCGGCAEVLPF